MKRFRGILLAVTTLLCAHPALAAGGGDSPQLITLNLGMFILFLLTFMVAAFLLNKFAWGPILSGVEEREQRIGENLEKADKLDSELAQLEEKRVTVIHQADEMAKEILADARKGGAEIKRHMEEDGKEEARILRENAEREIASASAKVKDLLKQDSADLAVQLASSILEKELDEKGQAALVDKLIAEI